MRARTIAFSALLTLVSLGCTATPVKFNTLPVQPNEEVIGPATGGSTGIMLFNVIPIGQNSRFQSAYQQALESTGGTRLVDITIHERWFWAYLLNGYSFKVTGTAVRAR